MRIAQLANFVGPASGGMRTAVEALGHGYGAAGAARLLIVPGPVDRVVETEHGDVVQVRGPRVGGGYRLIVEPWRILSALESFAPTSIEVNDKSTLIPVTRWARRNGVGSVLFSHERLDHMLALRTGFDTSVRASVGVYNKILARQFDAIVATSRFGAREHQASAASVGTPLVRIPLGVDLDTFRPHDRPLVDDDTLRLVHVGRLSREKSPHLAVATAAELHRRGVRVSMDVYGRGPHLPELVEIAGEAPVRFHGHVAGRPELARRIAAADISLSVCPGETFGLAVLEALACGTPVVTATTGGAGELIDASSGDWGAPDPSSLADAVLRVAAREVVTRRRAARARAERFPWQACIDAMLDLHAVVGGTPNRADPPVPLPAG